MSETTKKIIFVADNNENDRQLLTKAIESSNIPFEFIYIKDGEELLKRLETYYEKSQAFPKMILLDLNIQNQNSPTDLETLKLVKAHFLYKSIPLLVLSSEKSDKKNS